MAALGDLGQAMQRLCAEADHEPAAIVELLARKRLLSVMGYGNRAEVTTVVREVRRTTGGPHGTGPGWWNELQVVLLERGYLSPTTEIGRNAQQLLDLRRMVASESVAHQSELVGLGSAFTKVLERLAAECRDQGHSAKASAFATETGWTIRLDFAPALPGPYSGTSILKVYSSEGGFRVLIHLNYGAKSARVVGGGNPTQPLDQLTPAWLDKQARMFVQGVLKANGNG